VADKTIQFKVGDAIVHPNHGAGRIVAVDSWNIAGVERKYYSIELVNDHGTLMIPVDQAEEAGLRAATSNPDTIYAVLTEDPQQLDSDHRKRQATTSDKIRSGDAREITEALRDLAWREATNSLTERDQKLKAEAEDLLIGELALQPDLDLESAASQLHEQIQEAVESHLPEDEEEGN
jgi:CarD family transcriptional regulator